MAYAATMDRRGANELWLVCGSEPGAGQQLKAAYRSQDSGEHWVRLHSDLTGSGYVTSLTATSVALWLSLFRELSQVSVDGGLHWRMVDIPLRDDLTGFGTFHFIGSRLGWVTNFGSICRTLDGRHWETVSLHSTFPEAIATE